MALMALVATAGSAMADPFAGVPVLATPRVEAAARLAAARLAAGDAAGAAAAAEQGLDAAPDAAALHALRARALAAQGRAEAALGALARAAPLGSDAVEDLLAIPPLAALAADPQVAAIRAAAAVAHAPPPVDPARPEGGVATINQAALRWSAAAQRFEAHVAFPAPVARAGPPLVGEQLSRAGQAVVGWARRGRAAGHRGDLYDNRDRGHSRLDLAPFPQLVATAYAEPLRAAGLDYGLAGDLAFNATTFGNSSTAVTAGPFWRSLPRLALTDARALEGLVRHYARNHLYVYPAHRDHDGRDLFPAATPYFIVSQGASRSDAPFLRAIALALAALRPDAKTALREAGLMAPTLQMLLRRAAAPGQADADYLSGAAHPSAFRAESLDLEALVRRAQALTPDAIPPMARIAVLEEPRPLPGVEIFGDGLSEVLFDTAAAAARIARGTARSRRYVLSAAQTVDPNGRPLRFHWRVLRGDPARVAVRPLDAEGLRVEATIAWGPPIAAPGSPGTLSDRVDVAVFADNGATLSAPAFFSLVMPAHQRREYDAEGRPLVVDHTDPAASRLYADPRLHPRQDWRDDYAYDAEGRPLGWTRRRGAEVGRYAPDGTRVIASDAAGRPLRGVRVAYPLRPGPDGSPVVEEVESGGTVGYADGGRVGAPSR